MPFECLLKGKRGSVDKNGDIVTELKDGGLIKFTNIKGVDVGRHSE